MKLSVPIRTGDRPAGQTGLQFELKMVEIEPIGLIRKPCGKGESAKRFTYGAVFIAPNEALYSNGKSAAGTVIAGVIDRKVNAGWKPPTQGWQGNRHSLEKNSEPGEKD
jgi:hypothetical protein